MSERDPQSPQWEDCKVCGGDHWTKDHQTVVADRYEASITEMQAEGRRALPWIEGSGLCDATLENGWTCTRLPNHEGVHQ